MLIMRRAAAAPLAAALLLLLAAAQPALAGAPLSSSVLLFYDSEYEPHYGQPISQCDQLLQRAKDGGSNSVNLVPTHYWIDDASNKFSAGGCYPDNWAEMQSVDYFCSRWEWDKPCEPFTKDTIARFAKGFKDCLQKAHDMFDEVLISPHLDDGTKTMHWRNTLMFDPLQPDQKGNTYWDIMLSPIAEAVKAVYTKPGKTIVFGPQGEMGGTVFYAPASYQKIADRVRAEYKGPAKLKIALMFNHAYVPGVINRAPDDNAVRAPPASALEAYQGWGPVLPFDKWPEYARLKASQPALLGLLDSVDVLGVSCYPRSGATPKPEDFEVCVSKLDAELAVAGFNLKAWAARPGKALVLSELGLGGGVNRCGTTPAASAKDAGLYTHLDVGYPWSKERDPWSKPELRQYRRDWHNAAMALLDRGGINYPLSGAYLWSLMSMDPQGIHPATTSGGGTFADPAIADAIKKHNAAARGRRRRSRSLL
ncbi:hypothetical protein Rsub_08517 [Raphidocelis subcapitata]|uniref:Uncharacterized protein n=1 Tax=Raphidocelis subcapitata TaxID=307507 RepID=A0A2V0P6R9_9CHLO|nr:hypothetical protein Rsub_08517 [Raphidocelis subcapitata]|eukprot:GBF95536.1 hypothetical protein Rsub_08517 [Raphidocelis subcapitata]